MLIRWCKFICIYLAIGISSVFAADQTNSSLELKQENFMKINIDISGTTISGTLKGDSAAAADFYALLPLELTLTDYASTEKVSDLPKRLSTKGEPSGTAAKTGDITYYAPWGNLAIFHKDFGRASGLVKLGSLDSGLDLMRKSGPIDVTIRQAD